MIKSPKLNNTKPGIAKYTRLNPTRFPKRQGQQASSSVNFLATIPKIPFAPDFQTINIPKASQVPMPQKLLSELQIRRVFGERPMYICCANYPN